MSLANRYVSTMTLKRLDPIINTNDTYIFCYSFITSLASSLKMRLSVYPHHVDAYRNHSSSSTPQTLNTVEVLVTTRELQSSPIYHLLSLTSMFCFRGSSDWVYPFFFQIGAHWNQFYQYLYVLTRYSEIQWNKNFAVSRNTVETSVRVTIKLHHLNVFRSHNSSILQTWWEYILKVSP